MFFALNCVLNVSNPLIHYTLFSTFFPPWTYHPAGNPRLSFFSDWLRMQPLRINRPLPYSTTHFVLSSAYSHLLFCSAVRSVFFKTRLTTSVIDWASATARAVDTFHFIKFSILIFSCLSLILCSEYFTLLLYFLTL